MVVKASVSEDVRLEERLGGLLPSQVAMDEGEEGVGEDVHMSRLAAASCNWTRAGMATARKNNAGQRPAKTGLSKPPFVVLVLLTFSDVLMLSKAGAALSKTKTHAPPFSDRHSQTQILWLRLPVSRATIF